MDAQQNQEPIISNIELSSIYKSISVESKTNFDEDNESQFLEKCIVDCYDEEFRLIESLTLQRDVNLLNNSFVKLVHYCNKGFQYKNVSKMFIAYCDFFSLDYHSVYKVLHEKLQILIKNGFIKMLGSLNRYTKLKNKYNPQSITTLFELIANKNNNE